MKEDFYLKLSKSSSCKPGLARSSEANGSSSSSGPTLSALSMTSLSSSKEMLKQFISNKKRKYSQEEPVNTVISQSKSSDDEEDDRGGGGSGSGSEIYTYAQDKHATSMTETDSVHSDDHDSLMGVYGRRKQHKPNR